MEEDTVVITSGNSWVGPISISTPLHYSRLPPAISVLTPVLLENSTPEHIII